MKTVLITLSLLVVAVIVLFFILGVMSKSGKPQGLVEGKLSECPDKPNCICTEHYNDDSHFAEPVAIPEDATTDTFLTLKNVIQEMGGIVQAESDGYLAATFSSAIFSFMDDLEIRIDTVQKVIHIRSASRVGHSDMGVNRERVELLRKLYLKKITQAEKLSLTRR